MRFYRDDLARAKALGAHYVVFHVTDVSIEETYTYQWEHTHREVIDTAAEIINGLLAGGSWPFEFLMEKLWWPGFTMTDPEQTAYLLDAVRYPKRGIMLDTGHLMNTNPDLRSEAEGGAYNHSVLGAYGTSAGDSISINPSAGVCQSAHRRLAVAAGELHGAICTGIPTCVKHRPAPSLDEFGGQISGGACTAGILDP